MTQKHRKKARANPGLIQGFEAAIQNYAEIKIPMAELWFGLVRLVTTSTSSRRANCFSLPFNCKRMRFPNWQQFKTNEQGLVFKKALFRTFKILVNQYLLKLDEEFILGSCLRLRNISGIQKQAPRHLVARQTPPLPRGIALRARSFSKQSKDNITVIECASNRNPHSNLKIKPSPCCPNAPMGSGKTQIVMHPEFIQSEQRSCHSSMYAR